MLAAFYGRAGCIQTLLQAGVNKLVSPLGARRPPHLKQKVLPWAQTSASKRLRQLTAWTARLVARAARAHYRCRHGLSRARRSHACLAAFRACALAARAESLSRSNARVLLRIVQAKNEDGQTALHVAIARGNSACGPAPWCRSRHALVARRPRSPFRTPGAGAPTGSHLRHDRLVRSCAGTCLQVRRAAGSGYRGGHAPTRRFPSLAMERVRTAASAAHAILWLAPRA